MRELNVLKNKLHYLILPFVFNIYIFFKSTSVVHSHSVNSVVLLAFMYHVGLTKKTYYTATYSHCRWHGSRKRASSVLQYSEDMRHLHMQSYAIPFLFFFPLFIFCSILSSLCLSRRLPPSNFLIQQQGW